METDRKTVTTNDFVAGSESVMDSDSATDDKSVVDSDSEIDDKSVVGSDSATEGKSATEGDLKSVIVLFRAYNYVMQNVKLSLENDTLSLNEFVALEALQAKGSLTTSELIDKVLIANSSMTYVLDGLCKKGLVKREKDKVDRRIIRIELTDSGYDVIRALYEVHRTHMRQIFDVLSPAEEKQMQDLLKRVGKKAEDLAGAIQ